MLKRLHHIINYQQMRSSMPCPRMGPVALRGSSGGGRLLHGALHAELLKPLKEKVNQASLQR